MIRYCTRSILKSYPGRQLPWLGHLAQAKPPYSNFCSVFTTPQLGRFKSTARTFVISLLETFDQLWGSFPRILSSLVQTSGEISVTVIQKRTMSASSKPRVGRTFTTLLRRCRISTTANWASVASACQEGNVIVVVPVGATASSICGAGDRSSGIQVK